VKDLLKLQSLGTRRGFLKSTGAATLALAAPSSLQDAAAQEAPPPSEHVRLTINGRRYAVDLDPRTTLLDALREHFGLTGSKKGCDQGSAAPVRSSSTDSASIAVWHSR
jgi:xanthine dehydrogenase YagT iron-sulfur-binding subunit